MIGHCVVRFRCSPQVLELAGLIPPEMADVFFSHESFINKLTWSPGSGTEHPHVLSLTLKIMWQLEYAKRIGQTAAAGA